LILIRNAYYSIKTFSCFNHRSVMDIKAFLSLALNHNDTEAFMQIYYKCGFAFNKQFASIIKH